MKNKDEDPIRSVEEFMTRIRADYKAWNTTTFPWFRGEPPTKTPLCPKLYRMKEDGSQHDENQLVQWFRRKAPILGPEYTPVRENTPEWLCLMQHVGLPTRLLDWTEGVLVALYFAVSELYIQKGREGNAVVWMLNPVALNNLSLAAHKQLHDNEYPLTWVPGSIGNINFRAAWEKDTVGTKFPVAIHPTNIHPRMAAQKSCFTIQGRDKRGLSAQLTGYEILKEYRIGIDGLQKRDEMLVELRMLGVSRSSLFPELEGLAKELELLF